MSEQEIRAMAELDEAAEKAGGYVSTPFSSQTSYDYRKIMAYCRENGIDVLDLTLRQLQEFIIN